MVVFGSRGSLASAHLSNFWAAGSRSEHLLGVLTVNYVGQHSLAFDIQALMEVISLHLFYVLLLDPSWILQLEYLDLL